MSTDEIIEKFIENLHSQILKRLDYEDYLRNLPRSINLSRSTFLTEIKKEFKNRELVLVLGSGVSVSCGLPDWNKLLQIMLSKSFEKETKISEIHSNLFDNVFKPNNIITARYLLKHHNSTNFSTALKEALYPEGITESKFITEIVNLCTTNKNSYQLDSIITYNYDDILEESIKLKDNSFKFKPIHNNYESHSNNTLLIYHVHGYIPRNGTFSNEDRIVFSENSYHSQYSSIYNWQNIIQINKFRDKTCLFLGSSLTDPNTRRLLDIANSQTNGNNYHYIIKPRYDFDKIKSKLEVFQNDKNSNAIHRLISRLDSAGSTNFLIKAIEKFEEEDALSFNIKTLWVKDFNEIPRVLKKIYE
ncbi:MAG: hypothetical protein B6D61_09780 [Bacteroidetes bacterium 4484_249]|nr:MAG: hypothetical protein B6D61_09780 [Bacteroidetes bacterium 4484_249]